MMRQRRKVAWLLALVAVLVGINVFRPFAPEITERGVVTGDAGIGTSYAIPDATFDTDWLELDRRVRAKDVERNIFEYGRAAVQARPVQPTTQAQAPPQPPPPPPKPKPPFQFFGFAEDAASGSQRVFLTDGDNIFVARQGDLVMERFRVIQIDEESIQIEDTRGEQRWVLPLQQP